MSRADNGYATHQQPHQIDDELMQSVQSDGGGVAQNMSVYHPTPQEGLTLLRARLRAEMSYD